LVQPIIITGFMASGKTCVALALGHLLHCHAIDLDQAITETEGRTPRQIIEEDGETVFRQIETRRLQQTLELDSSRVIALGGGAWTIPANRQLIAAQRGLTVWLNAPFELCWQRIAAAGKDRPLAPTEDQARTLYHDRRSLYELAALHLAAHGDTGVDELAEAIARAFAVTERGSGNG
jgi:shikimate kinase